MQTIQLFDADSLYEVRFEDAVIYGVLRCLPDGETCQPIHFYSCPPSVRQKITRAMREAQLDLAVA